MQQHDEHSTDSIIMDQNKQLLKQLSYVNAHLWISEDQYPPSKEDIEHTYDSDESYYFSKLYDYENNQYEQLNDLLYKNLRKEGIKLKRIISKGLLQHIKNISLKKDILRKIDIATKKNIDMLKTLADGTSCILSDDKDNVPKELIDSEYKRLKEHYELITLKNYEDDKKNILDSLELLYRDDDFVELNLKKYQLENTYELLYNDLLINTGRIMKLLRRD